MANWTYITKERLTKEYRLVAWDINEALLGMTMDRLNITGYRVLRIPGGVKAYIKAK